MAGGRREGKGGGQRVSAGIWHATWLLAIGWAVALLYGEMVVFWRAAEACTWPGGQESGESREPIRVALIADPQLPPREWRAPWRALWRVRANAYLRRSFQHAVLGSAPAFVFLLGDIFQDGAGLGGDGEWFDSLRQYGFIFDDRVVLISPFRRQHVAEIQRSMTGLRTAMHEVAGNRDVGFADFQHRKPEVLERFAQDLGLKVAEEEEGGEVNFVVEVGGTRFVVLNTAALEG